MPSGEKCSSHDECFKRLYSKMETMDVKLDRRNETMDEKLDRIMDEFRNRMHEGDLRFKEIEMRLARCEEQLRASASGRSDVRQKLVGSGIDLLKAGVIALVGAAAWAFANGYRG
jgi:hypothetical protein